MPARLTLYLRDRPARVQTLREGNEYLLGRDADCAVHVDDDRVSRHHARLRGSLDTWQVADLRSKNGTQVDGITVHGAGQALQSVSWVSFGGLLARFEQLSEAAAARLQDDQLRRWQSSVEMQRRLTPSLGLGPLLERLLDSVLQLSRTERAFVLLRGPEGALALAASRGLPPGAVLEADFAGSVGAVDLALREGRTVATSDAEHDPRLRGRPSIAEHHIRALVCVPLVAAERLLGAVYADSSRPGAELTELDVDILGGLAAHAALAITVARLDAELAGVVAGLSQVAVAPPDLQLATPTARSQATASARADDTGLRWDELLLTHRERGERPR